MPCTVASVSTFRTTPLRASWTRRSYRIRSCGIPVKSLAHLGGRKWRFLLPGTSEPRLTVLPARACFSVPAPLTRRQQPEHSCHWQLSIGPITAEPCRAKAHPLHPRRSYFAPAGDQPETAGTGLWWRRRVPPPGPKGLFRWSFITIVVLRRRPEYSVRGARKEALPGQETP